MMKAKRFAPFLIAVCLFCLTILYAGKITGVISDLLWIKPGVIEAVGLAHSEDVLLGSIFQNKALRTANILPMYGSSELGSGFEFNPTHVFANRPTSFTPFVIERGYCQNLVHVLNIAAPIDMRGKKIVISFSPDWYAKPQGIPNDKFSLNSSHLKVYDVLFNPDLSPQLKLQIIKRILDLPRVLEGDDLLKVYLETYYGYSGSLRFKHLLLWPAMRLEYAKLQMQDAVKVRNAIRKLDYRMITKLSSPTPTQPVDWEKLKEQAVAQAKTKMKNNLNIVDDRYAQYANPESKDFQKGAKELSPSVEYDDLKLMLDLLHEKQVQPLFVMIPYNGLYWEFAGSSSAVRQAYYQKITHMIRKAGFEVVDLSAHEKELYYMQDPNHLGWKGWAELNKIVNDFYHEKKR